MKEPLVLKSTRYPPDWVAAIESVLRDGEDFNAFVRDSAVLRELKRRGTDVEALSPVRPKGRPKE